MGVLNNSNIVQYLESGHSKRQDIYWFAMEILVGEALDEWMEANGTLSEIEAVKVATSLEYKTALLGMLIHPILSCRLDWIFAVP